MANGITITRLRRIVDVVRLWPFLREGILYEARYLRYELPLETYRKILFTLVRDHKRGWVGVATSDASGDPVAFVFAHDVTPLFAERREWEVSMFYYVTGHKTAIPLLQDQLDTFCRKNGIHKYYLTTTSFSSSAGRVFKDSWRGLERSNTVFARTLT